jgi:3-dehydro-L-gulonate 2-dehydrogenase
MSDFIRVPASDLKAEFHRVLIASGFDAKKASACAEIFANNSIDGIYSHGVNRFARFVGMVKAGTVKPAMEPILKNKFGNVEQWNGQLGPGPLNAVIATDRAIELARASGIGCVALSHTNHWMRGGAYGWRAAKAGCVFMGWSNTIANTPAWGAINHKLGNNPFVLAVPHGDEAVVLDMAMSQFSYGAMEMYELKNEQLPVYGGFDTNGKLTKDPSEIRKTQRTLPIGYWKGAGLSLLLDVLGAVLSDGLSVAEITAQDSERNLSQVFIAIDVSRFGNTKLIGAILDDFKTSIPDMPGKTVRYPGENVIETRAKNLAEGIPVSRKVWDEIRYL